MEQYLKQLQKVDVKKVSFEKIRDDIVSDFEKYSDLAKKVDQLCFSRCIKKLSNAGNTSELFLVISEFLLRTYQ